ncbi:hypothetical protein ACFL6C_09640 [Myxococcota bacterium]
MTRVFPIIGFLAACLLVGCMEIELEPIEPGGSTVPVPDMTKVSFAENGLTGDILIVGTDGSVGPVSGVYVKNETTGTEDATVAAETGAFAVVLTDALLGHHLTITADEGVESDAPAELDLGYEGTPPPAPLEFHAVASLEDPGHAGVNGAFSGEGPQLQVRIINATLSTVTETHTQPEAGSRWFESLIEGEVGDEIFANGTDLEYPGAPGRFARTEVVPE